MRTTRWLCYAVFLALPVLACEPAGDEPATEGEPAAEQVAPGEGDGMEQGADAGMESGAMVSQAVEVTNAMPHPMIVFAVTNGDRTELGTVDANATDTFAVDAAEGGTLELVAEDEEQTHDVEHSVMVTGDTASWTLGG